MSQARHVRCPFRLANYNINITLTHTRASTLTLTLTHTYTHVHWGDIKTFTEAGAEAASAAHVTKCQKQHESRATPKTKKKYSCVCRYVCVAHIPTVAATLRLASLLTALPTAQHPLSRNFKTIFEVDVDGCVAFLPLRWARWKYQN